MRKKEPGSLRTRTSPGSLWIFCQAEQYGAEYRLCGQTQTLAVTH